MFSYEEWYERFKPLAGMSIEWDSLDYLANILARKPECLIVEVGSSGAVTNDNWTGTRCWDWMAQFSEKRSVAAMVLETSQNVVQAGMANCKNSAFLLVESAEAGLKALESLKRADAIIFAPGNATPPALEEAWTKLKPGGILAIKGAPSLEQREWLEQNGGSISGPKGIDIWHKPAAKK